MDPQSGAGQPDILIGQTVGNYLVTQKLGEGGMGSVYLAEHPTIGKRVALKVLHSEFCQNQEVAARFITEAKSVNAIGHPNIVDIVDYGVIHTGVGGRELLVYFIMEYLSGQSLSQVIRTEAPLPPERALTIAMQVADALAASHKCNIVHRDLKPDNIMISQRGREHDFVKLLDFGIAKLTGGDGLSSHKTRTGLVLGTPAYMSPEQCEGRPNVDHRTDIYALGICLYEMLTGRVPFIGEGYGEILVQHLTQAPIEPSRYRMMSPHVEQVVLKALEKRAEMRYPTMDEFMRAMADPVGYVEAHGGIGGFLSRQLMPSAAPLPPMRITPGAMTPVPGGLAMMTPAPGTLNAAMPNTTLGSATGQMQATASRTKFLIAGALVALVAIVAVIFVVTKKEDSGSGSGSASGSTVAVTGSGSATETPTHSGTGSAATQTQTQTPTGSGSATTPATPTGSAGSATVIQTPPPPPEVTTTKLTITSKPEGAEIYIDGIDSGFKTNATLDVPKKNKVVNVMLKLSTYKDTMIRNITLDADAIAKTATLDKVGGGAVRPLNAGNGKGSAQGTGKGSAQTGTGHKDNDTGLMRPEDL